jgi:hypothetical protein
VGTALQSRAKSASVIAPRRPEKGKSKTWAIMYLGSYGANRGYSPGPLRGATIKVLAFMVRLEGHIVKDASGAGFYISSKEKRLVAAPKGHFLTMRRVGNSGPTMSYIL